MNFSFLLRVSLFPSSFPSYSFLTLRIFPILPNHTSSLLLSSSSSTLFPVFSFLPPSFPLLSFRYTCTSHCSILCYLLSLCPFSPYIPSPRSYPWKLLKYLNHVPSRQLVSSLRPPLPLSPPLSFPSALQSSLRPSLLYPTQLYFFFTLTFSSPFILLYLFSLYCLSTIFLFPCLLSHLFFSLVFLIPLLPSISLFSPFSSLPLPHTLIYS